MNIVLIDSGIDATHKAFENVEIINYLYDDIIHSWRMTLKHEVYSGHGTGVASIIINNTEDITIYSFKVFDEQLQCTEEMLLNCLEYVYNNIECSLINMSLGTLQYNEKLYNICKMLENKNVIIISAFSNDGGISYPAAFDCVIGVDASFRCIRNDQFVFVRNSVINVKAKGANQRIAWIDNKYMITQGASYACGYVTNFVIKLYQKGVIKFQDILQEICNKSSYIYETKYIEESTKEIIFDRVALFPYNKEISSIVNFADDYKIQIAGIFEHPRLGHVGMDVKSIYSDQTYKIKSISQCDWDDFDLMVIGHLDEQENQLQIPLKKNLLDKCLRYRKNVYSLDEHYMKEYDYRFAQNNLLLYYPKIQNNFDYSINLGKLYHINVPVVAIFGTSKRQGKFTIQLLLRKYLMEMGYQVGQIGTEPHSLLFKFDCVIPMGYESFNNMNANTLIPFLNKQMHLIEKKGVDIILAGAQSGTIPHAYNNMWYFNNQQLDFLCGIAPDAAVLCINYHDEISYIQRTIKGIEAVGNCAVIALCLFPLGYLNDWDLMNDNKRNIDIEALEMFRKKVENTLNCPVYITGSEDMAERIGERIFRFFGGQ